jgi:hypothetical protein
VRRAPRPAWLSRPPRTVLDANANAARSIQYSTRWDGGAGLHLRLRALVLWHRPRGEGEGEEATKWANVTNLQPGKQSRLLLLFPRGPHPHHPSIHPSIHPSMAFPSPPPLIPYHASSENEWPLPPSPSPSPFPSRPFPSLPLACFAAALAEMTSTSRCVAPGGR